MAKKPETVARALHTKPARLTRKLDSPAWAFLEHLARASTDALRRDGRYVQLITPVIQAGDDPDAADVAAALREILQTHPDLAVVLDYVAAVYVDRTQPRRVGRRRGSRGSRTLSDDLQIARAYFEARRANPRQLNLRAEIAERFSISLATLERILTGLTPR